MRIQPDFLREQALWEKGIDAVAGVDEVGVGSWAGPVVAAAVIFSPGAIVDGLADSKMLTAKRRETLSITITERASAIGIGQAEAAEVDHLNIYWAAMLARRRAEALALGPEHILADGRHRIAGCGLPQTPWWKVTRVAGASRRLRLLPK